MMAVSDKRQDLLVMAAERDFYKAQATRAADELAVLKAELERLTARYDALMRASQEALAENEVMRIEMGFLYPVQVNGD